MHIEHRFMGVVCVLFLLGAGAGCTHQSAEQRLVFSGYTVAGRPFSIWWVRAGFGKSWDKPGRGLTRDQLAVLWYPFGDKAREHFEGRKLLVPRNAGERYVGQFDVRSAEDRIWLVRRQDQSVFAAADLSVPAAYKDPKHMPSWATPQAGTILKDDTPEE